MVGYTALNFHIQVSRIAESKFCKTSPSVFNYYLFNEAMHVLVMNEACVAVLFGYKWLHIFLKAVDEV